MVRWLAYNEVMVPCLAVTGAVSGLLLHVGLEPLVAAGRLGGAREPAPSSPRRRRARARRLGGAARRIAAPSRRRRRARQPGAAWWQTVGRPTGRRATSTARTEATAGCRNRDDATGELVSKRLRLRRAARQAPAAACDEYDSRSRRRRRPAAAAPSRRRRRCERARGRAAARHASRRAAFFDGTLARAAERHPLDARWRAALAVGEAVLTDATVRARAVAPSTPAVERAARPPLGPTAVADVDARGSRARARLTMRQRAPPARACADDGRAERRARAARARRRARASAALARGARRASSAARMEPAVARRATGEPPRAPASTSTRATRSRGGAAFPCAKRTRHGRAARARGRRCADLRARFDAAMGQSASGTSGDDGGAALGLLVGAAVAASGGGRWTGRGGRRRGASASSADRTSHSQRASFLRVGAARHDESCGRTRLWIEGAQTRLAADRARAAGRARACALVRARRRARPIGFKKVVRAGGGCGRRAASASDGSIVIISFITRCAHQATSIEGRSVLHVRDRSSASSQTERGSHAGCARERASMLMSREARRAWQRRLCGRHRRGGGRASRRASRGRGRSHCAPTLLLLRRAEDGRVPRSSRRDASTGDTTPPRGRRATRARARGVRTATPPWGICRAAEMPTPAGGRRPRRRRAGDGVGADARVRCGRGRLVPVASGITRVSTRPPSAPPSAARAAVVGHRARARRGPSSRSPKSASPPAKRPKRQRARVVVARGGRRRAPGARRRRRRDACRARCRAAAAALVGAAEADAPRGDGRSSAPPQRATPRRRRLAGTRSGLAARGGEALLRRGGNVDRGALAAAVGELGAALGGATLVLVPSDAAACAVVGAGGVRPAPPRAALRGRAARAAGTPDGDVDRLGRRAGRGKVRELPIA